MKTSVLGFLGAFAFAFAGAALDANAQTPKRGGTLQFAISAETPHYDCHGSDTYATLHFSAPFYSTLLRFNLSKFPEVEGDLHVQASFGREIPRRYDAHLGRHQSNL
jgi:peptide/nickel transport system substrate-binding protein